VARRVAEVRLGDEHGEVVRWYRDTLAVPAVFPWVGCGWEPLRIGPTWQTAGDAWVLPAATLGWDVLGWCGTELQHRRRPWRFTLEQARFILWWFAVDDAGQWLFRDGVLQRLKGWGKDPIGACLLYVEMLGPCRVAGMVNDEPVAVDNPEAWAQTAATSLEQTKNTMRLMPALITPEAKAFYRVQVGKELIHAMGDERLIQAVTSSPATLEGARASVVLKNETQHWLKGNDGHAMADVIERNATKSEGGAARTLAITNAYQPAEDSVAQHDREAFEEQAAGRSLTTGILYDSLEAPPEAPLTAEAAPAVVASIRGDSTWLNTERIVKSILDTRNPPERSRRFWYNQITAEEDAWVDPQKFDARARPDILVADQDELAVFFDGSKSDDATALVGCRLSDGHVVTLGMWQRPPGERGKLWVVPRAEVNLAVEQVFDRYRPVAFYADPSHTKDDVTQEAYWDGLIDEWHRRFKDRLSVWAKPGAGGHSIMWDMSSPARTEAFTLAAMRCTADIEGPDGDLTWDGDSRLRIHVRNALRHLGGYGVSLRKPGRESPRKIDLAVCMVGARMARRDVLNRAVKKRERTGRASFL